MAASRAGPGYSLLLAIFAATLLSAWQLEIFSTGLLGAGGMKEFQRFFAGALEPTLSAETNGADLLPGLLEALKTTILVAFAAMSLALACGFALGCLTSEVLWAPDPVVPDSRAGRFRRAVVLPGWLVSMRAFLGFLRSIHEIIWVLIGTAVFGLSMIVGVLALAIPYAAVFGRIFAEILDETPTESANALRATGAGRMSTFLVGLLPRAAAPMLSYSFYRFDCALRSSAVLGFVGFPTLGLAIRDSANYDHFREVWTYLYVLFAMLVLTEIVSGKLRRRITAWR